MDQNFLSLIVGIVSSLIATALFIGLSELWRKVVRPWFEDKIYRGIRIDGVWTMRFIGDHQLDGSNGKSVLELCQKADRISGLYYHTDKDGEKTQYKVSGHIRDMFLMITAQPNSSRVIDAITMLYHIRYQGGYLQLVGAALSSRDSYKVSAHEGLVYVRGDS